MAGFTIGKLAKACGIRSETLRYYEKLGLITSQGRKANGYRVFTDDSLLRLQFIGRAKLLNFTLEEIKDLFVLRSSADSSCEIIYERLQNKIKEINRRIAELTTFRGQLKSIAKKCPRGDASLANCSLMDFLDKPVACCDSKTSAMKKKKSPNFKKSLAVLIIFCLLPLMAQAKPIPYKGGWMIMQENYTRENLFHAVYGLSPDMSAGLSTEWFKDKGYWLHSAQFNYLAYRKNMPDAQMNIFLMSGVGAGLKNDVAHPAAWSGILADYETRRIFISYDNNYTYANTIESSFTQKARFGVAPYIGAFDDLHTWAMIQLEHYPDGKDEFVATPLIRLFKDNYLVELGYSTNSRLLLNWNITF